MRVILEQLGVNKNIADSTFILHNFIHFPFCFREKLISIENNSEIPHSIFQLPYKVNKKQNDIAFICLNGFILLLYLSMTVKELIEKVVF